MLKEEYLAFIFISVRYLMCFNAKSTTLLI